LTRYQFTLDENYMGYTHAHMPIAKCIIEGILLIPISALHLAVDSVNVYGHLCHEPLRWVEEFSELFNLPPTVLKALKAPTCKWFRPFCWD
jgi:hypothetical protein